jgi:hypothetical protein
MPPPSSESKNKPSKKAGGKQRSKTMEATAVRTSNLTFLLFFGKCNECYDGLAI